MSCIYPKSGRPEGRIVGAATPGGMPLAHIRWHDTERTHGAAYDARGRFACEFEVQRTAGGRVREIRVGGVIFQFGKRGGGGL